MRRRRSEVGSAFAALVSSQVPSILDPESVYAGFDLSLTASGYAVLQGDVALASGVLKPPKDIGEMDRLHWIRASVEALVCTWKPAMTYLEAYAFSQANRAHQMGELGGVVRLRLAELPYNAAIAPIGVNKKFCSGKGNAKKEMLIKDVYKRWGFEARDNNEADAYSLARLAQAVARREVQAPGLVLLKLKAVR